MTHFSRRFTGLSGTASLMEDLGAALNQNPHMIFMGGGNPAHLPEVEACFARHVTQLAQDANAFHKLVGEYQPPQGDPAFLTILAAFLQQHCSWPVTADNIAITHGGQSAFFTLFNILASDSEAGSPGNPHSHSRPEPHKKIVLPLVPDYLGYADTGLIDDMFIGYRPQINTIGEQLFKYAIDFDALQLDDSIAGVCVSRPANPSGNIITDDEINQLKQRCAPHNIPLIIDVAYGKPFPNVTFVEHALEWDNNTITILSLSKLGLPGTRTGIVIAAPELIRKFSRATAGLSLAPSNLGAALCKSLIVSDDLLRLTEQSIRPYYQQKMEQTQAYILGKLQQLPVKLHKPEGAFFFWLWFQDLPISSQELYERLKRNNVLTLSGHHFFQSLDDKEWAHQYQCMRLSYCQPWERVKEGIDILVKEIQKLY